MPMNNPDDINGKPKPSKEDLLKSSLENGVMPSDESINDVILENRLDEANNQFKRTGVLKFIDLDIKPEERLPIKIEVASALEEKQLDSGTAAAQKKIRRPLRM